MLNQITDPEIIDDPEDLVLEQSLRPQTLHDYFGQTNIKQNVTISIQAARKRREPIDHLLLYGPPGLGKTTLAKVIGNELKVNVRITSGPAMERAGDLASILTNLGHNDILFIDEMHRLNKVVEETLYPAMEEKALDLIVGKGPSARTLRLDLAPFTIIGATTRVGLLSGPMRDRFGSILRLDYYHENDLVLIIARAARILNVRISRPAMLQIAGRARGTPRIANRLLKRVRDYAEVHGHRQITPQTVTEACTILGVDPAGLDYLDRKYLGMLNETFNGGPVGIETLAAALSEDTGTLEDVVEPFLIQKGLIKKTPRGRVANSSQKPLPLE